jgi:hypothetical protein
MASLTAFLKSLAFKFGKNKGHPDEKDIENARKFSKNLLSDKKI